MPFTIVVVTPLITIMEDQVEYLNKIGVAAAMMGGDMDEAVKSGSCEIVTLGATAEDVPSLTSPPPSLLFFRAPFYFAPLPTI